jgi:hypothetical protein
VHERDEYTRRRKKERGKEREKEIEGINKSKIVEIETPENSKVDKKQVEKNEDI